MWLGGGRPPERTVRQRNDEPVDPAHQGWHRGAMTESVTPRLGRLTPVPPRDVWRHEAHSFTPWLLENVDVLSDLLNMELVLDVAEHPVGGFSLDLMGRDETTGEVVIVENQLETSDHGHLGQILTYAAGTDPTTIVWVAAQFRAEHRAAVDWLNARTDENTRFFAVELGVVRIGASDPAPLFKLIAQPNDWEKTVRTAKAEGAVTEREVLYREFWTRWLEVVRANHPTWSRATRPPKGAWFTMTAGSPGATFYTTFTRRGLSSELVFESQDAATNTARYSALLRSKDELEDAYGFRLDWQDLPGRKATRVADYLRDAQIIREDEWPAYLEWLLDRQQRLRNALTRVGGIPHGVVVAPSVPPDEHLSQGDIRP